MCSILLSSLFHGLFHNLQAIFQFGGTTMQIFVKALAGKVYTIEVNETGTVMDIKNGVLKRSGIAPDRQRLIFSGKQLDEERALSDYDIKAASTVHLVMRLNGGTGSSGG